MTATEIRVLDTGTRRPDSIPETIDLHHHPALIRRPTPVDDGDLERFRHTRHHVVFYSRFAARTVIDRLPVELSNHHRIWAVGTNTAQFLERHLNRAVEVPASERFTGLHKALSKCGEPLPIAAFGLRGTSRDLGWVAEQWSVDFASIPVYESVPEDADALADAFDDVEPDWLTVTSSRGVRSIADAVGSSQLRDLQESGKLQIAAIGPSTAVTLGEFGLDADAVPETPDRVEMLDAIANWQP